jgi:hypothetical protein
MTEEELKQLVRTQRQIPEWFWTHLLSEQNYVEDALLMDSREKAVEFIKNVYDEHVAEISPGHRARGSRGGEEKTDTVQASLKEVELERQAALEQYLAMCAACDQDIYGFRKKVLKRELLAEDQAWELLKSQAAALMEAGLFKRWKVPIIGHTAEIVGGDERFPVPLASEQNAATITVHPPGITRTVEMPIWAGISHAEEKCLVGLEFPNEEGRIARRKVWSTSLLGELAKVGERLSERYRWQPAQAVWFVLTGEIPAVPALTVTRSFPSSMYHHDVLITVEASPWVSSKTVEKAYRKAQIKTLGSSGGRPLGMRALKLLRFVIERIESLGMEELRKLKEGKRPPGAPTEEGWRVLELVAQYPWYRKMPNGKRLVREWNEKAPKKWSYGDNTRWFWKDYHRTKKAVAFGPPYQ